MPPRHRLLAVAVLLGACFNVARADVYVLVRCATWAQHSRRATSWPRNVQIWLTHGSGACAQVSSYDLEPLPDLEADFGPSVPSMGIEGVLRVSRPAHGSPSMLWWLFTSQHMLLLHASLTSCSLLPCTFLPMQLADPRDACSPFTYTDYGTPWVALISRQQQLHAMNCTFDIKVRTIGRTANITTGIRSKAWQHVRRAMARLCTLPNALEMTCQPLVLPLMLPHTLLPALPLLCLCASPTLALSRSYAAPNAASHHAPTLPLHRSGDECSASRRRRRHRL